MAVCLLGIGAAGCGEASEIPEEDVRVQEEVDAGTWEEAQNTPYGKYPSLVTYTLGQMSGANNDNLPVGDTYEDNAYTRYLREMLNVQNENVFMESEDRYGEFVNVIVNDQNLPDVMVISDRETLKTLVENDLVEDLTEVYESCTSDRIKEMYDSYGEALLKAGMFEGKLMAVPETVIDHGPNLLWLRKDWMGELGLEDPENLDEAMEIIEAFQENRMGAGEGEDPIGLVCDTALVGTTSSSYSMDAIFQLFGASPQKWIKDANGKIVYGSLTEETKGALAYLNDLYERGILDQDFALRAQNNLRDLVVSGKCGAFFGLWWTPNNPLMDAVEADPDAQWKPYYLTADCKESAETYSNFRDNKYVVVRKGYEHPEIVMKIISVLFDYTRYEADDADEVNAYFALNVDPKARPLVINVDYNDATYKLTENLRKTLDGESSVDSLSAIEKSYYDACSNYLNEENYSVEDWAAYESRVSAVGLLVDGQYQPPVKQYLGETDGEVPQTLQNLEKNTFIQIIMGKQPIEYFRTFVSKWYSQGGKELTEQINSQYQEK